MSKVSKLLMGLLVFGIVSLYPIGSIKGGDGLEDMVTLDESNVVVLQGEMDATTVAEVIAKVRDLDNKSEGSFRKVIRGMGVKGKPIYLFLNTPGGSIQAGLEMFEAFRGLNRPIHTITLTSISMGFQTVQNLGNRYILKNGTMMSHRARGQFEGYFGGMRPSQMDSRYNFWLKRLEELDEQTVSRTKGKQTVESYQKAFDNEMWLTGSQAVEQGYADKVVAVKCDSTLVGTVSKSLSFLGAEIQFDLDKCPLNTGPMNVKQKLPTTGGFRFSNELSPGSFGPECLRTSLAEPGKVCVLDTSLTPQRVEENRMKFLEYYQDMRTHTSDRR